MQVTDPVNQPTLPTTRPQYEFSEAQNQTIGSLASALSFVGIVSIVFGVCSLFLLVDRSLFPRNITQAVYGVLGIAVGVWMLSAADSFRKIVTTRGSDIDHLMMALDKLALLYQLMRVLIIVAIAIVVLTVLVAVFPQLSPGYIKPSTTSPVTPAAPVT